MKKSTRALIIIAGLIGIIVIVAIIYQQRLASQAIPDYNKHVSLKGLEQTVKVHRDSLGIPHIYAQNQRDLYKATGYIMAQDRMWQMDLLRRVTLGRLAEIFGEDFVQADMLFRALRFSHKSRMILDSISPQVKSYLQAFTNGINQYMQDYQGKLPPEFTILGYQPAEWKMMHTINLIGYMAWDLSGSWETEMILYKLKSKLDSSRYKHLIPDMAHLSPHMYKGMDEAEEQLSRNTLLKAGKMPEQLGLQVFTASNNWAVSADKSANGNAMLANDMHLGLNIPGIWMQMHQVIPGKVNVTGVALPGAPFIISGHNKHMAWGLTNVMLDDIDFYRETVNPADSNQYKVNGQWRDMRLQQETIRTDAGESLKKTLRFTHRGPVISSFKDAKETISMRWVGNSYSNELLGVYKLNYGKNWADFKSAARHFRAISQNFAYADKEGNIGLYTCAGLPKRVTDGYQVFPGDTTLYDWKGFVPFDSLPHVYNPEKGFVYSANNKIVTGDYPYYISYWYDLPYRARRIHEFLDEKERVSVAQMKNLQNDVYSKLAEDLVPRILAEVDTASLNGPEKQSMEILRRWDYYEQAGEAAPAILEETFHALLHGLLADEMNDALWKEYLDKDILPNYVVNAMLKEGDNLLSDDLGTEGKKENFATILRRSFKEAVASLKQKLGPKPSEWQWGDLHTLTLNHPLSEVAALDKLFGLSEGPHKVGGSFNTVMANSYNFNNPYGVVHGVSQRHIYSAANWDKSLSVIPTGNSGIPASLHFCDQTGLYAKGRYHADHFTKEAVKANQYYYMEFRPE